MSLDNLAAGRTYYYYVVSSDEAGNTATNNNGGALYLFVAPSPSLVLLVDEYIDPDFGVPPLTGYTDPLDQLGVGYDAWDVATLGEPTLTALRPYRVVLWRVPELTGAWSASEQLAISNYLQTGGSLFVASMEILSRLDEVGASSFIRNVLQVQSFVTDENGSTGAAEIIGSSNETVGNGMDAIMDYSVYENIWSLYIQLGLMPDPPDLSDTITPTASATAVLRNDAGDIVGLRWPGIGQRAPGRLVFMSCPFDAVPMGSGVNDRAHLLQNILSFLAPGSSGLGTVALDSPSYKLPSGVTVEVGDADQAGQSNLTVTARSTTETNGLTVTLLETTTPGVFTGTFDLIAAANPPTPGKLRAQNGDLLQVDYFDASANRTLSALATVDTLAPTISNVAAEPDYEQATISWDTSEPADSLVQFGESPILNRTASDANSVVNHGVTLPALTPDRTYYYRVVSRDAAGNSVMDDNHGQLYTSIPCCR